MAIDTPGGNLSLKIKSREEEERRSNINLKLRNIMAEAMKLI